jgi:hypothetical protein
VYGLFGRALPATISSSNPTDAHFSVGPPLSETFPALRAAISGRAFTPFHPSDLSFVIELDIAFPALLDAA